MGIELHRVLGSAPQTQLHLVWPFLLALWMAWCDMRTNRIPNYLVLGTALAGLAYQAWLHGWTGVGDGFLGIGLGFALLIFFYRQGGLGAGDVKALAALGAWLGPRHTVYLFICMAISGVLVIVGFLWWRGLLWDKIRRLYAVLVNFILAYPSPAMPRSQTTPQPQSERIPYAICLALGMALLCWRGFTS